MSWIHKPLDLVFAFNSSQQKKLEDIRKNEQIREDLKSWTIFTITLPIVTFCLAAAMNILLSRCISNEWGKILNNGSLPIIAFGIVSSAVSYLVEQLKSSDPTVHELRKRVMAVSLLLLFITASLFLFQSLTVVSERMNTFHHFIVFLMSLLVAVYSVKLGRKMYLLQSSFNENYADQQNDRVDDMIHSIKNTFSPEEENNSFGAISNSLEAEFGDETDSDNEPTGEDQDENNEDQPDGDDKK